MDAPISYTSILSALSTGLAILFAVIPRRLACYLISLISFFLDSIANVL
ncbi:MAG: hypothetical protein U1C19_04200 [Methanobacteriaceae archaeon]|nr:hypothetical protein [Methanobacteriaceae archaeon]